MRGRIRRHHIRDSLQRIILTGEQKPGSKLRQQELAERFGVAQGVVREALLELQAQGLVESIDNRGVFVSRIDKAKLLEAFEVREFHEALAARLCCQRVTREEVGELEELAERIHQLGSTQQLDEMGSLDREFHSRLIHLSRNSMLIRLADNYRVLGKIIRAERDPQVVWKEHLAILHAIERGAADEAEQLVRQHVGAARVAVEANLESGAPELHWVL